MNFDQRGEEAWELRTRQARPGDWLCEGCFDGIAFTRKVAAVDLKSRTAGPKMHIHTSSIGRQ